MPLGLKGLTDSGNSYGSKTNRTFKEVCQDWANNIDRVDISNNYGAISTWDVSLVTDMSGIFQNKTSFNEDITKWNTSKVTNMKNMFTGASNFNQPINTGELRGDYYPWDVSKVKSMSNMFKDTSFNQPITHWQPNNVTTMSGMFENNPKFNQSINVSSYDSEFYWDLSLVKDMSYMFKNAISFNREIHKWNVTNVTSMQKMFEGAILFNQSLNTQELNTVNDKTYYPWNVFKVKDMSNMFKNTRFNQSISAWQPNNVTTMSGMFENNTKFNQNISTRWYDSESYWNVSLVKDMSNMFKDTHFNQSIVSWQPNSVTTMSGMFENNPKFNQDINSGLSTDGSEYYWDVSLVKDMSNMFKNTRFNQSISAWQPNNVTTMSGMFENNPKFNQDINSGLSTDGSKFYWDVSLVKDMSNMFKDTSFNQPITHWQPNNVTTMSGMFENNPKFNQSINFSHYGSKSYWNVSLVKDMSSMFKNAISFNQPITHWQPNNVTTMSGMFENNPKFNQSINFSYYGSTYYWDLSLVKDMSSMFKNAISFNREIHKWNVTNVTSMQKMFEGAILFNQSLNTQELNTVNDKTYYPWNVFKVKDMSNMFKNTNFNQLITNWQPNNVTTMSGMFENNTKFNQNISTRWDDSESYWNVSLVKDMSNMFKDTHFNESIVSWQPNCVTTMSGMFENNPKFNQDINSGLSTDGSEYYWDVSLVKDMSNMFKNTRFNQSITYWQPNNVTTMSGMFENNTKFNQDINSGLSTDRSTFYWDVSLVKDISSMFKNAISFNREITDWKVKKTCDLSFTFTNVGLSIENKCKMTFDTSWNENTHFNQYWKASFIVNNSSIGLKDSGNEFYNSSDWSFDAICEQWIGNKSNNWTANKSIKLKIFAKYGHISNWDVSLVTNMVGLFSKDKFNENISNWNTSNVTDMNSMFWKSTFNQPIGKWNTSKVTNMSYMFDSNHVFNQPIDTSGSQWDVSKVTNMKEMFSDASFNQPIGKWDVSKVTVMSSMFKGSSFNQPISQWNTSKVEDMDYMFKDTNFNQPLDKWDVTNAGRMNNMFENAKSFNYPLNSWRLWGVNFAMRMFLNATSFNQDLSNWHLNNPSNSFYNHGYYDTVRTPQAIGHLAMFDGTELLRNISKEGYAKRRRMYSSGNWDHMTGTKIKAKRLGKKYLGKPDIQGLMDSSLNNDILKTVVKYWVTSDLSKNEIIAMCGLSNDINKWDTRYITDMSGLFQNTSFNENISDWNTSNVTNMNYMFKDCSFNQNISNWNTKYLTSTQEMFYGASNYNQPMNSIKDKWNTYNIKNVNGMFREASKFNQDISSWRIDVSGEMNYMFYKASEFNQDISNWNINHLHNTTNFVDWDDKNRKTLRGKMLYLLLNDYSMPRADSDTYKVYPHLLTAAMNTIKKHPAFLEIAADLSGVLNSSSLLITDDNILLLSRCYVESFPIEYPTASNTKDFVTQKLSNIDKWDVSRVTNMDKLFQGCDLIDLSGHNINTWNTSNVTSMSKMFYFAKNLHDCSLTTTDVSWNTSKVTNMDAMFSTLYNLRYDTVDMTEEFFYKPFDNQFNGKISNWNTSNVTSMKYMFAGATSFNQKIDTSLVKLSNDISYNAWDVSKVTSMRGMFWNPLIRNTTTLPIIYGYYGYDSTIDFSYDGYDSTLDFSYECSNVIECERLRSKLDYISAFNQSLNSWNLINCKDTTCMFRGCTKFNQPINNWNTGNITTMKGMFFDTENFNQSLTSGTNRWNTDNVLTMDSMFAGARKFNQPIHSWNVSKVKSFRKMFANTKKYDLCLSVATGLSDSSLSTNYPVGAKVFQVHNKNIFNNDDIAAAFLSPIPADDSPFDFVQQQYLYHMRNKMSIFNQSLNNWDLSSCTNLEGMFEGATYFNQPLDNWNTKSVVNMKQLFLNAYRFNQNISDWNTSEVTTMESMFNNAYLFNQSLKTKYNVNDQSLRWDVSKVTNMSQMFSGYVIIPLDDKDFQQGRHIYYEYYTIDSGEKHWGVSTMSSKPSVKTPVFNQDISNWNISSVINLMEMFVNAKKMNKRFDFSLIEFKNGDISYNAWDTSKIEYMDWMFENTAFNNDSILNWDTSNVKSLQGMFAFANDFNQPLLNWDTSNVTNMYALFEETSFNQPIYKWNTTKVTDMANMFNFSKFNQNINTKLETNNGKEYLAWNIENCRFIDEMFKDTRFNQPINRWNTSKIYGARELFAYNPYFNQSLDPSFIKLNNDISYNAWDLGNCHFFSGMFQAAASFNQNISSWNTINAFDMSDMFRGASAFNQPIENWNVANCCHFTSMFASEDNHHLDNDGNFRFNTLQIKQNYRENYSPKYSPRSNENRFLYCSFNQSLNKWNLKLATDLDYMFNYNKYFNQDLHWNISNVTTMAGMFANSRVFNQPLNHFDTSKVIDMQFLFENSIYNQPLNNWNTSEVTDMEGMFKGSSFNQPLDVCGNKWNVSKVTMMSKMFSTSVFYSAKTPEITQCKFNQNINNWDTSNVNNMEEMFFCNRVFNQPLNWWITTRVTNMSAMFSNSIFNQDIKTSWDEDEYVYYWNTLNVQNMNWMFSGVFRRRYYKFDIFDSNNNLVKDSVKDYYYTSNMYFGDVKFNQPISNWNTSNVISMEEMFSTNPVFNQPIDTSLVKLNKEYSYNAWNLSNCQTMNGMFSMTYSFNQPLNDWNTTSVTDMAYMFHNAKSFNQPIGKWNISEVANMNNMFSYGKPRIVSSIPEASFNDISFGGVAAYEMSDNSFGIIKVLGPPKSYLQRRDNLYDDGDFYQIEKSMAEVYNYDTIVFNQPIDTSFVELNKNLRYKAWDTINVTGMYNMFGNNTKFNQPIGKWNTRNVRDMSYMFVGAPSFSQKIDTTKIDNSHLFRLLHINDRVIAKFPPFRENTDAGKNPWFPAVITRITGNTCKVRYDNGMSTGMELFLSEIRYIHNDIDPLGSQVKMIGKGYYLINEIEALLDEIRKREGSLTFTLKKVTTTSNDISYNAWDVSKVTNMCEMFNGASNFNQSIGKWNTSKVKNVSYMLSKNYHFNQRIDTCGNYWNTNRVTNMEGMFWKSAFNQPIGKWNTSEVINMKYMFEMNNHFNQQIDTSGNYWNTNKVKYMNGMFKDTSFNQSISYWRTDEVTDMSYMFKNSSFNQQIDTSGNQWKTSQVTDMQEMFNGATKFNQSISKWDVSGVGTMKGMFKNATSFNKDISKWKVKKTCDLSLTFIGVGLSIANKKNMTRDTSWNENAHFNQYWKAIFTGNNLPTNNLPTTANVIISNHNEDTPYTFKLTDFSFNDADAQDTLKNIQITSLPSANAGKLYINGADVLINKDISVNDISNNKLTYVPKTNFYGDASFNFKVHDGTGYSIEAKTFTIKVVNVNDPPTSANITISNHNEDTPYTFKLTDFSFNDVDGDVLEKIEIISIPSRGTLKLDNVVINL